MGNHKKFNWTEGFGKNMFDIKRGTLKIYYFFFLSFLIFIIKNSIFSSPLPNRRKILKCEFLNFICDDEFIIFVNKKSSNQINSFQNTFEIYNVLVFIKNFSIRYIKFYFYFKIKKCFWNIFRARNLTESKSFKKKNV